MHNITDTDIRALGDKARAAGDNAMLAIAHRALMYDYTFVALTPVERDNVNALSADEAREQCIKAIQAVIASDQEMLGL